MTENEFKALNRTLAIYALYQYVLLKMSAGDIDSMASFSEVAKMVKKELPQIHRVQLGEMPKVMTKKEITKFFKATKKHE